MFNNFQKVQISAFKALLRSVSSKPSVILNGTPKGFEVYLTRGDDVYKLYTQRKTERFFKSPNTAFTFLDVMGVNDIEVREIGKVVGGSGNSTNEE